ncbi:MAG: formylglycine-generating enzyme family protein [Gallionella sp.]|nr:formylglycine-generating enzyme family protein [Gallionella sp.]
MMTRLAFGIITALCFMSLPATAQAACSTGTIAHPVEQNGKSFRDTAGSIEMAVIPAGSFEMGFNPSHRVTIAKPFELGKTEVTQAQWRAVMGNNPGYFKDCGDNCPVEQVSWNDAHEFIRKLNAKSGKQYRLPSESEWEYACRAGGQQEYCGSDDAGSVAWYGAYAVPPGTSGKTTNPVATKQANAFCLHDMSGNVWEWVEDSNHESYNGAPADGSAWLGDGVERMLRGGSWNFEAPFVRAAFRIGARAEFRSSSFGFRVARTLP